VQRLDVALRHLNVGRALLLDALHDELLRRQVLVRRLNLALQRRDERALRGALGRQRLGRAPSLLNVMLVPAAAVRRGRRCGG
jgi:hypothetical protein